MKTKEKAEIIDLIMDFESGQLSTQETVNLFQNLIDTKLIFSLQGFYQRMAKRLIESGHIKVKGVLPNG
jgi:hypothetical protein